MLNLAMRAFSLHIKLYPYEILACTHAVLPTGSCQTIWLDELDLNAMEIGWGSPHSRQSVEEHKLSVAGTKFDRGVGTHAVSTFLLSLHGSGRKFTASVGVDDEVLSDKASIVFYVLGDRRILSKSPVMKRG